LGLAEKERKVKETSVHLLAELGQLLIFLFGGIAALAFLFQDGKLSAISSPQFIHSFVAGGHVVLQCDAYSLTMGITVWSILSFWFVARVKSKSP